MKTRGKKTIRELLASGTMLALIKSESVPYVQTHTVCRQMHLVVAFLPLNDLHPGTST